MNTMIALFKREWFEHQGGFGWGPVIVSGVLIAITLIALVVGSVGAAHIDLGDMSDDDIAEAESYGIQFSSDGINLSDLVDGLLAKQSWTEAELEQGLDMFRHGVATPFYLVYFIIAFFVLLSALYDDRKDRTVLFWKSIPVTDTETVLSKLITTAWVAPAATIVMIFATQVFFLIVVTFLIIGSDHLSTWQVWSNSGLIVGFFELIVGYIIQGLWALPIYGWLLFVSSAVTKVPFVWAVLTPVVPMLLERAVFGSTVLAKGVGNHLQFKALPMAAEIEGDTVENAVELSDIFALLATTDMWFGIVVGAAFMFGAVYFRRRNNEI